MGKSLHQKWNRLCDILKARQPLLIAFSGGVDSTLVLAAARRQLPKEKIFAATAVSASLPLKERTATAELAEYLDVPHRFVETRELENPSYAANPSNRCYFCKSELFSQLAPLAKTQGMTIVDGFNMSDRADYRPGFQASQEWHVVHPLNDADITKEEIRILSRWLHLPTWNKPASPCLSSRIPYGTPVAIESLSSIEHAEDFLHAEGFPIVRVRHYGDRARIEVPLEQIARLSETQQWKRIVAELERVGYRDVEWDPRGFKSGRLNETLEKM